MVRFDITCPKPFTSFDTDWDPSLGIAAYVMLGFYDSVFFGIFGFREISSLDTIPIQLGLNISR